MPRSALDFPQHDPTPIFEQFRGSYATELLAAAIAEFRLFERLAAGPMTEAELRRELNIEERPFVVLLTAMRAMGLVTKSVSESPHPGPLPAGEGDKSQNPLPGPLPAGEGVAELALSPKLALSPLAAEHLVPGGPFFVGDYVALAADSPGVQAMSARLRTNRPAHAKQDDPGAAFIFRQGLESAMDHEASARRLTLALAGRAKNAAPHLAERARLENAKCLLDIGGGTGIYSVACLQRYPHLKAIVWDRPEVLKVAREFAAEYGVAERLTCSPGDMFADAIPGGCDVLLLSNILHDWDVPECRALVNRCAAALPVGGRLLIHDVFLNDALDGPLPIALYSAALFSLTEGRAYSAGEYRSWLTAAGLTPCLVVPTLIHCGILAGVKN